MRRNTLILGAIAVAALGLPGWALQESSEQSPSQGKGLDHAQMVLSEKEHSKMGLFVVTQLDNGVRGKALADAIHQEHALLKADQDADKRKGTRDVDSEKKGPGEALKHGLEDKDLTNFGKFVNEQHAAGLRGEALADAIQKRHEEIKAARRAEHTENHQTPHNHGRHRSGGRH